MKKKRLRSRKPRLTAVGIHCADHETPIYPERLALTSPTSGGRSVGIVRLRTTVTEFSFSVPGYFMRVYKLLKLYYVP
jgi:hypothetical protein